MLKSFLSALWRGLMRVGVVTLGAVGLLISLVIPRPDATVVEQAPSAPSASAVERTTAQAEAEAGRGFSAREDVKLRYVRGLLAERAAGGDIRTALLQTSMLTASQRSWLALTTVAEAEVLVHESEQGLRKRLLGIGKGWTANAELVAERERDLWTCGPHGDFEYDRAAAHEEFVSDLGERTVERPAAG